MLISVDFGLRASAIKLISWIGYDTHSELATKIVNGIFIVLFFNTGVLLLLVNANLADVSGLLGKVFSGTFYDYSPQWYATVGNTIMQKLLISGLLPPFKELITNFRGWYKRSMDSKNWACFGKAKKKRFTLQARSRSLS